MAEDDGTSNLEKLKRDFNREGARAIINISRELSAGELSYWSENPEELEKTIATSLALSDGPEIRSGKVVPIRRSKLLTVPEDGKWFNLEINHNLTTPDSVLRYINLNPELYEYLGPEFRGKYIYKVKLVSFNFVQHIKTAEQRAAEINCCLLEGQAVIPFREMFKVFSGGWSILFGGSQWRFLRPDTSFIRKTSIVRLRSLGDKSNPDLLSCQISGFQSTYRWAVRSL